MAFPLALIPVITELLKQIPTKPRKFIKEGAGIGIGASIMYLAQDVESCAVDGFNALSCVTPDHWGLLIVSVLALVARLDGKRKGAASD